MYHDPVSALFYQQEATEYAEFCLLGIDLDEPDRPVAKASSVPFSWAGDPAAELPPGGYDAVILAATADRLAGRRGNLVSPIEIAVRPDLRGRGLSKLMLDALRDNTARLGYPILVAPVRPSHKARFPELTMRAYLARVREDGLPADPWLRVHARAGGRIVGLAPRSMTIAGTLAEWREWTGLPFTGDGPVTVPDALVPVHVAVAAGHAVYVEPNVWVRHDL
jgi:GNAT superfamily N-acetyltransferase